jgi:branched-chain amino acid transport system permease protein
LNIIIAQIINGIVLGCIYSLLVTGFNLMFLAGKIIHFSYPYIVILSMYVCWGILQITDKLILIICGTVIGSVSLHLLIAPIFYYLNNKINSPDINTTFIVSLGIAMIITEIMSHHIHYGFPVSFPPNWLGNLSFLKIDMINISIGQVLSFLLAVLLVLTLFFLTFNTQLGRAFRALTESIVKTKLQGITVSKLNMLLYTITGSMGGIIALLLSMLLGSASPWLADHIALKVLAIAIVAGAGNLKGGLICGLLLGIAESVIIHILPGSWANTIAFAMMLIAVLIRPKGIFI